MYPEPEPESLACMGCHPQTPSEKGLGQGEEEGEEEGERKGKRKRKGKGKGDTRNKKWEG